MGVHPKNVRLLDAGALRPQSKLSHSERTGQLHNSFYSIICTHRPSVCVIEKAFTGVNPHSALRLGETRGALIAAARRADVCIDEIAATKVKKTVSGSGHATKEQVALAVEAMIGFKRANMPHDVTDAIAIALSYALLWPIRALSEDRSCQQILRKLSLNDAKPV